MLQVTTVIVLSVVIAIKFSQTSCLGLSFETINSELWHLEGVKTILTPDRVEIPTSYFCFYVIGEMSGCLKQKLGQKLVASGHIRQVLA